MQRTSRGGWLATAILIGTTAAGVSAARADDCASSSCPQPPPSTTAKPAFHVEKLGNNGVKLTPNNGGNYAITVTGTDSSGGPAAQAPTPGEAWHKSVDAEVEGKLGYFFNMDLHSAFTNVMRDADAELFSLQPVDSVGDNRRAMEKFDLKAGFLGDRFTFTSSRRASTLIPLVPTSSEAKGVSEQDRLSAWLWRSGNSSLSFEGGFGRVDAGYQDLTKITTNDPLQTKNRATQQLRSNLKLGWAGFYVSSRDAAALAPDQHGDRPKASEIEAGMSVALSGLHDDASGGYEFLSLLPDSVWVSVSRGSIEHSLTGSLPGQTEKSAVGMTRNWNGGAVNLSYWQSTVDTATPLPAESQWRGHGLDLGGNVSPGSWSMSGNLSWYTADNFALLNNSAENSLNGSLFVSWRAPSWPKLSAGITNYDYGADFIDYHGLERNSAMRYQLMLDCSSLVANALSDKSAQLSFLASFDANNSRSQWSQTGYSSVTGNMFFGLRFVRPILP